MNRFTMTRKQYLATQVQVVCPHCQAKFSRSRNDWRTRCPLCLKDTESDISLITNKPQG